MRKLIAAINLSIDGFCDHTGMVADEELHQYFTDLLNNSGGMIYGRTTYQLMESYWPGLVKNPSGNKADDDFALAIDEIPKILFSRTLKSVGWKNVRLANKDVKQEVTELKQQPGKDLLVGSPSMIVQTTKLGLVDEYQLTVHPVILGTGLPLFKGITGRFVLKLLGTKPFSSGVVTHYYQSSANN